MAAKDKGGGAGRAFSFVEVRREGLSCPVFFCAVCEGRGWAWVVIFRNRF